VTITASIVSHGHGALVEALLHALAVLGEPRPRRVIVTFNVPEPASAHRIRSGAWPFEIELIDNARPQGFGANHNQAFDRDAQRGASDVLAVINPDIQLPGNPFAPLCAALAREPRAGLAYPRQTGADGRPQDFERRVPTPARLWRRYARAGRAPELAAGQAPEWVNAAFVLLRRPAWMAVGGFDTGYRMYCEDVDLCLRLQLAGWRLVRADDALVGHTGQRASHRDARHFIWHLGSLLRLWRSAAWRDWRRRARAEPAAPK
jgi:GT2 family glycosyltransferase